MAYSRSEVFGRACHFATKTGRVLEEELGFGVHGMVWSTDQQSVVKVHGSERLYYERERDIYLRLREQNVRKVLEFHVPEMRAFDDELLALEIAIVQPPFVIDFAGAYLDQEPDFSPEVWAEWEAEKREQFGEHWGRGQSRDRCLSPLRHLFERRLAEQHPLRMRRFPRPAWLPKKICGGEGFFWKFAGPRYVLRIGKNAVGQ